VPTPGIATVSGLALASAITPLASLAATEGWPNSISGEVATRATGAKSVVTSNGTSLFSHLEIVAELSISSSVWPSGAALATDSVPTVPPAPVRFSTTTFCLSRSCSFSATSRPIASTPPPAAIGTTRVMLRCGFNCASTGAVAASDSTAASHTRRLNSISVLPAYCVPQRSLAHAREQTSRLSQPAKAAQI
jgi:hypothetical protein